MSADNMPPLPAGTEHIAGMNRHFAKVCGTVMAYTADDMHTYAREYAAEQVRELVEALTGASNYIDKLGGVSQSYRILIAKHQPQQQADGAPL